MLFVEPIGRVVFWDFGSIQIFSSALLTAEAEYLRYQYSNFVTKGETKMGLESCM